MENPFTPRLNSSNKILDAKAANGVGVPMQVDTFLNLLLDIYFSGATLTLKIQGSSQEDCPDFGSAVSSTNRWIYLTILDLSDQSGSITSKVASSLTSAMLANIQALGLKWINAEVSEYSAGSVTVRLRPFTNQ